MYRETFWARVSTYCVFVVLLTKLTTRRESFETSMAMIGLEIERQQGLSCHFYQIRQEGDGGFQNMSVYFENGWEEKLAILKLG